MDIQDFRNTILAGLPDDLPAVKEYDKNINHAPHRKDILSEPDKKLALKNALRYFPVKHHPILAKEFLKELKAYGRIYMYRYRPDYKIKSRHINDFPYQSKQKS